MTHTIFYYCFQGNSVLKTCLLPITCVKFMINIHDMLQSYQRVYPELGECLLQILLHPTYIQEKSNQECDSSFFFFLPRESKVNSQVQVKSMAIESPRVMMKKINRSAELTGGTILKIQIEIPQSHAFPSQITFVQQLVMFQQK